MGAEVGRIKVGEIEWKTPVECELKKPKAVRKGDQKGELKA